MNAEEIKELIEVTKTLSYLEGFVEGFGVNQEMADEKDFPLDAKNINEVHSAVALLDNHHTSLVNKFKTK